MTTDSFVVSAKSHGTVSLPQEKRNAEPTGPTFLQTTLLRYFAEKKEAPPRGAEHTSKPSGKSTISAEGAAESAAIDTDLVLIIASWPKLSDAVKAKVVELMGYAEH